MPLYLPAGAGTGPTRYPVGPFGRSNVATNATSALGWVYAGSTDVSVSMPRAGTITAITVDVSPNAAAVLTAGQFKIQVLLNGVLQTAAGAFLTAAVGTGVAAFPSRCWRFVLTTPIAVAAGGNVGGSIVADASFAPTGTLDPSVLFEFTEA